MLTTSRFRLALASAVLVWLVLRVLYWNGYYTEDAPGYVTDAIFAALGNYHPRDNVNGLNVGTYLPVAIPIRLFGKSEIALSLWPMLCSLLGVLSLAGAATILFGGRFGLLAAFLYATYPGDVFFSTVVMPDSIQAGWFSLSMFLLVLACAGPAIRRRWILASAGVAMGCCHLIRANDVILVPVGLGAVVLLSRVWKRETSSALITGSLAYLTGWAVVIALEGLAYLWAANDFLLRLHVVNRHYGTLDSIGRWGLNTDPRTLPFSVFPPLVWWARGGWGRLTPDSAYHGLLFCLALGSLLIGAIVLLSREGRPSDRAVGGFAVAILWFSWPLLAHQFGSQSITQFVPMHRLSRHFVVYAPGAVFAMVAGCFLIAEAASGWRLANGRRALTAAAGAVLLWHLSFNWRGEQIAYAGYHRIKNTYTRIRERLPEGVQTMIADPGDLGFFDFWLNPLGAERVRMMAFANYSGCDEMKSGVVLTQSNPGWERLNAPVIQDTVKRLACLIEPPANWRLVYDGYPEKIYQIESATVSRRQPADYRTESRTVWGFRQ